MIYCQHSPAMATVSSCRGIWGANCAGSAPGLSLTLSPPQNSSPRCSSLPTHDPKPFTQPCTLPMWVLAGLHGNPGIMGWFQHRTEACGIAAICSLYALVRGTLTHRRGVQAVSHGSVPGSRSLVLCSTSQVQGKATNRVLVSACRGGQRQVLT